MQITPGRTGPPRLGIDIGRVIIDGPSHPAGGDTAFFTGDEATLVATPEMPGAMDVIARLVDAFAGQVWLVSKCGPRVQARTLVWLRGNDFHARTGLPADQVRFCRTRPDKRLHCEELGLTHFVDDRLEVLSYLHTVAVRCLFRGRPAELQTHAHLLPQVAQAATWAEVLPLLGGASRAQA